MQTRLWHVGSLVCALTFGCGSDPQGYPNPTAADPGLGGMPANTGGTPSSGAQPDAVTGGMLGFSGGSTSGGSLATEGSLPGTGGLLVGTGGVGVLGTGGVFAETGGAVSTGGLASGGAGVATGGASPNGTGGAAGGAGGSTGGAEATGGSASDTGGAAGQAGAGTGGAASECPSSGNITYVINQSESPTDDELDAYERLAAAMDEAVWYYDCYTDIEKQLWVNYDPGVPTAQANIDGWMSFGTDRGYMVVATAMHEIAHTVGIGFYNFAEMTDGNGIWTGENANAVLASIPNPRDTELHADSMHFWPYGLNYASEHENEDDLINHCRIVAAIRQDMGLD